VDAHNLLANYHFIRNFDAELVCFLIPQTINE